MNPTESNREHRRTMLSAALPSRSSGVALVIALLLLLVITISAVVAMRSALFGDMISQNMRSQNLALQSAEIALRYCEDQVTANSATLAVFELNDSTITNEWQQSGTWATGSARLNSVPAAYLGTTISYNVPPQCIVRRMAYLEAYGSASLPADTIKPEDRGISADYVYYFRVTARGYSPDFQRDTSGNSSAGAEVVLQSMLRGIL